MNHEMYGYGLWSVVIVNWAIFLFFAFSFYHLRTKRDWRSFGAFSAFVVALFTEMYGFPLDNLPALRFGCNIATPASTSTLTTPDISGQRFFASRVIPTSMYFTL